MRVVFARQRHDFSVELVLDTPLDQYGHGFRALVTDNLANQGSLEGLFGFCGGCSSYGLVLLGNSAYFAAPSCLATVSAMMVLARAMERRVDFNVDKFVNC